MTKGIREESTSDGIHTVDLLSVNTIPTALTIPPTSLNVQGKEDLEQKQGCGFVRGHGRGRRGGCNPNRPCTLVEK
jgi:hypothetical protein